MKNYAVLITGEVTRSLFVTADNPEEAQAEACSEWSRNNIKNYYKQDITKERS